MDYKKFRNKAFYGKEAEEFLSMGLKVRNDLRYHKTNDVNWYFETEDGQIILAMVSKSDTPAVISHKEEFGFWPGEDEHPLPHVFTSAVYPSEEALLAVRNAPVFPPDGHPLLAYTKDAPDYLDKIEQWRQIIANRLDISLELLDYSLGSLKLIDNQRKKKRLKQIVFLKELFGAAMGYVYEYVRRYWNGRFEMRQSVMDETVWEPVIITADGNDIIFFDSLWDEAYEYYSSFSLYDHAERYTRLIEQFK